MIKKALIVEDDTLFATLVKNMLLRNNYDVVKTFNNGKAAINYLKDNKVSLITMDIDLIGDLNGLETTEKLRGMTKTPVLFMSARQEDEVSKITRGLAPSLFLNKFSNKEQFSQALVSLEEASII